MEVTRCRPLSPVVRPASLHGFNRYNSADNSKHSWNRAALVCIVYAARWRSRRWAPRRRRGRTRCARLRHPSLLLFDAESNEEAAFSTREGRCVLHGGRAMLCDAFVPSSPHRRLRFGPPQRTSTCFQRGETSPLSLRLDSIRCILHHTMPFDALATVELQLILHCYDEHSIVCFHSMLQATLPCRFVRLRLALLIASCFRQRRSWSRFKDGRQFSAPFHRRHPPALEAG